MERAKRCIRLAASASWDPRTLRLGVRWVKFLPGLRLSGRGLSRGRVGLPKDTARKDARTATAEGTSAAPGCGDPVGGQGESG